MPERNQFPVAYSILTEFTDYEVNNEVPPEDDVGPSITRIDFSKMTSAISELRGLTGRGEGVDPFINPDGSAWNIVATILSNNKYVQFGLDVWLGYLDICYELQSRYRERIHKGSIHYNISLAYEQLGEGDKARCHLILSFIEDCINYEEPRGCSTFHRLVVFYKYQTNELEKLIEYIVQKKSNPSTLLYPEELLIRYEYESRQFFDVLSNFNKNLISSWIVLIESQLPGTSDGLELETLSTYLFNTIPGTRSIPRKVCSSGEIDVVLSNKEPIKNGLPWKEDYFCIECKDRKNAFNTEQMAHFASKLSISKVLIGIVITRKGLAGAKNRRHAEKIRELVFNQSGTVIVDIRLDELHNLSSTRDLLNLLRMKYEGVKFR